MPVLTLHRGSPCAAVCGAAMRGSSDKALRGSSPGAKQTSPKPQGLAPQVGSPDNAMGVTCHKCTQVGPPDGGTGTVAPVRNAVSSPTLAPCLSTCILARCRGMCGYHGPTATVFGLPQGSPYQPETLRARV